ncbi:uncharacterized protein MONBRDRAFT_37690 [Monosiga brevicollis MX1]|uniref:Enkurin domain-containing protein n=1 Tax=Monosiga brevicollis TaxID=81824 RepID=A9V3A8_MONBE|nr:uncharacterized protein MONBRDRAFT_37690 [Monosiga brevicollis MX1]EDQ88156.1 predicted protein [Monosiga brevicollis MX1]|eukprot:XP_001747232.1 hypothetical protein [Monosiga brevicollis MX1]
MESIYNLVPREMRAEPKGKRYVSKYATQAREEYKGNKQGGKTMGPAKVEPNSTTQFLKRGMGQTAAVNHTQKPDRTKPNKAKKPPVPKHNDAPVMGLKSQKNFIKGNAIAAMTLQPTQREELVLDATGRVDPAKAGLKPTYSKKKDYGKTPAYLTKRKQEEERATAEYEDYMRTIAAQNAPYEVPEDERQDLLRGLKANWDQLHKEYLGFSMVVDTATKQLRKKDMEKRLAQLESDIQLIENHPVILVQ